MSVPTSESDAAPDAANSWESVSLAGESDFHTLEAVTGAPGGVHSARCNLLTSTDNYESGTFAQGHSIDVAGPLCCLGQCVANPWPVP